MRRGGSSLQITRVGPADPGPITWVSRMRGLARLLRPIPSPTLGLTALPSGSMAERREGKEPSVL